MNKRLTIIFNVGFVLFFLVGLVSSLLSPSTPPWLFIIGGSALFIGAGYYSNCYDLELSAARKRDRDAHIEEREAYYSGLTDQEIVAMGGVKLGTIEFKLLAREVFKRWEENRNKG